MLTRSLLIALVLTLIAGVPLYFLGTNGFTLSTGNLPLLLLPLFLFISAGAYFSARSPNSPARTAGANQSRDDHDSADRESGRESGNVKWFNANKGFGFITRDSGEDIFVHFRSIRGEGRRVLRDGQRVEFAVVESKKGLQAEDVAVAG